MDSFSLLAFSDAASEPGRLLTHRQQNAPSSLSRKDIVVLTSWNVCRLDCFVQRGNMLAEHSPDAAEIGLRPCGSLQFTFIQASQLGFYFSRILQGRRTLGFQQL
jgi:hypothetical protein